MSENTVAPLPHVAIQVFSETSAVVAVVEEAALEDAIGAARTAASRLDATTVAALHARTRRADDDGDLAALARSVARPGLKARVEAYRAAARK